MVRPIGSIHLMMAVQFPPQADEFTASRYKQDKIFNQIHPIYCRNIVPQKYGNVPGRWSLRVKSEVELE